VPLRWLLVDEYTMGEPDVAVAVCADIDGLFVDAPAQTCGDACADSVPGTSTLLGCRPEPPLDGALDALGRGDGQPGGARHRRRINASIYSVASDGTATRLIGGYLHASVSDVRPSTLADGLLDVTFDDGVADPLPKEARQIWELWRTGRPIRTGAWTGYDRQLRHQWSAAALAHHRHGARDAPAGITYHLAGGHITDVEGFYCAIGEAINGPGGYFGWNANALDDCLRGGWGATPPFGLIWHDSAVARTHLHADDDQRTGATEASFEELLQWLTEGEVNVTLL
jgi:hypothetical protein